MGRCVIVTNAKKGWVEYSSNLMMPKLHKFILSSVEIYSARNMFMNEVPMVLWKERMFLSLLELDK